MGTVTLYHNADRVFASGQSDTVTLYHDADRVGRYTVLVSGQSGTVTLDQNADRVFDSGQSGTVTLYHNADRVGRYTVFVSGQSGTVTLDQNADRVGRYTVFALDRLSDSYEPLLTVTMTNYPGKVSRCKQRDPQTAF